MYTLKKKERSMLTAWFIRRGSIYKDNLKAQKNRFNNIKPNRVLAMCISWLIGQLFNYLYDKRDDFHFHPYNKLSVPGTFTQLREVYIEHIQRLWHTYRGLVCVSNFE